jgi:hypothetical protein
VLTVSLFLDRDSDLAYGSTTFRFWRLDDGEAQDAFALVSAAADATAGPPRSVRPALSPFLQIIVALILLPAVAFASPPDPSWIVGIYDGADGDDSVILVYESAATNAAAPAKIDPPPCLPGISLESIVHGSPGGRFTRGPRAPPGSGCTLCAQVFNSLSDYTPTASGTEAPVTPASITKFRQSRLPSQYLRQRPNPVTT